MEHFSRQERIYTLIGILMALFLGALDQTIVSTALPRIVEDLHGLSRYAWVATSYLVASTALVPIYGKLADMHNRKTIELFAVITFLTGSFLCGIAGEFGDLPILGDGMSQLIIFRGIQGLGGAGLFALAFIIIADLFPPAERGKYQGLVGAAFGIASVLGPYVGGLLTDHGGSIIPGIEGWRWVFYVNLPFGALALWFIITKMPPLHPKGHKAPISYISAALLLTGLVPLVVALQLNKKLYPWDGSITLGLLVASAVSLVIFSLRTLKAKNPILDFSLFRNKVFSTGNLSTFLMGAAFFSIIIFLPLFMVNVLGVSATKAGVSLIPLSLGLVAGSIGSGQLVSRFGHYKRWMLGGGVVHFFGVYLLSQMTPETTYFEVTIYMLICGLGIGPSMPLYTLAIQNAVDMSKIGQATSAVQFFRQIGSAIGAAVMGTVMATTLSLYFATHMPANLQSMAEAAPAGGEGADLSATGGADVEKKITEGFLLQYQLIEDAVKNHDEAAIAAINANPNIPADLRGRIVDEQVSVQALPAIKVRMMGKAKEVIEEVQKNLKLAFTHVITKIYTYTLFIIAAAWLATWLIPELPLRKTFEPENIPAMVE